MESDDLPDPRRFHDKTGAQRDPRHGRGPWQGPPGKKDINEASRTWCLALTNWELVQGLRARRQLPGAH